MFYVTFAPLTLNRSLPRGIGRMRKDRELRLLLTRWIMTGNNTSSLPYSEEPTRTVHAHHIPKE